ncbi:NUDIX domain-containing protein [Streptosporangium algeriense]|uniref:NUDIX domain-containing protein n=1 Tax=Streptosporangium algeriense TaxID=1682748 RepID=A0ABW3DM10_9ACTN
MGATKRRRTGPAVRELKEEIDLTVQSESLYLAHVIHDARGIEAPNGFLTVVFAAHEWSGTPTNGEPDKHAQVCWAPPQSCRRTSSPPRPAPCIAI